MLCISLLVGSGIDFATEFVSSGLKQMEGRNVTEPQNSMPVGRGHYVDCFYWLSKSEHGVVSL